MILTPVLVRVTNFARWREQVFHFRSGVTYVVGPNGVGKTSLIVDSWAWALGRITSKGVKVDDVISQGEDSCRVDFAFRGGKIPYEVVRYRGDATEGDRVLFAADGQPQGGRLAPAVQQQIQHVLGSDVRTLLHQTVFAQRARHFSALTEGEQRKLLEHYLGLSIIPSAHGIARKDLQHAEQQWELAEQRRKQSKVVLLSTVKDLKHERESLLKRLKVLTQQRDDAALILATIRRKKDRVDEMKERMSEACVLAFEKISALDERISLVKQGKCVTCHQPVPPGSVKALKREREDLRARIKGLQARVRSCEAHPVHEEHEKAEALVVQARVEMESTERQLDRHTKYATKTNTVEQAKMTLQEAKTQMALLDTQKQRIQFWLEGFSGKGIRRDVMRWALPVLSKEATSVASQLGIEEVLVDEGEQGALRIQSRSLVGGGELTPFGGLSGGEKTRVDFSLAEGLRGLARVGLPTLFELEVYDDPLTDLDAEGIRLVIQYLQRKSHIPIYVLSPRFDLADEFDRVVEVKRTGRWAKLIS